jgi:uracil-DNA glycosylase family 4
MNVNESEKLSEFREEYFSFAKKHELYKNIINTNGKIVFGRGSDNPEVVFIGEAPGQQENKFGRPFVGRSGKLLDKWISELNLESDDFTIINVVPIIPLNKEGGIRKPTDSEINYFLPLTEKYLSILNPKIIILLGRSAASIFDKNLVLGETKKWKNSSLFFIYHPSYYLRKGGKGYEREIDKLKEFLNNNSKQLNLNQFD